MNKNQIAFNVCSECKKNNTTQPLQIGSNKNQVVCPIHGIITNCSDLKI